MLVNGQHYRTIWPSADRGRVFAIDQRRLPFEFLIAELDTWEDCRDAIADMLVRGAPLIGATAAYGICLALSGSRGSLDTARKAAAVLVAARPTAVNLSWALNRLLATVEPIATAHERIEAAFDEAGRICDEDVEACRRIGAHGLKLIRRHGAAAGPGPVNILTHCNAGWLATIDWGTATAPIYLAHEAGISVHVWVDETRPRNQGARLTAWEFGKAGIPHTVIVDNAGGHLMQRGEVDLCIVGTDRTTRKGDVANKIGTYLKALAARDNAVPFYVAAPSSSVDWNARSGLDDVPIEERHPSEVETVEGQNGSSGHSVRVVAPGSPVHNPSFDVTPARLVTGLITERGVCQASEAGLCGLFPELS